MRILISFLPLTTLVFAAAGFEPFASFVAMVQRRIAWAEKRRGCVWMRFDEKRACDKRMKDCI